MISEENDSKNEDKLEGIDTEVEEILTQNIQKLTKLKKRILDFNKEYWTYTFIRNILF